MFSQLGFGMLQAIIRPCGTVRPNVIDCGFKRSGIAVLAYGKFLYDLRVVVSDQVGIIANLVLAITRKFYDGQFDFLVCTLDIRVLGCGAVNKGIDSGFQRGHAFCFITLAHGVLHTAGGIQHHDNIQGLCIGGGGRRIGGQRRQRDQEISVFDLGHLDGGLVFQFAAEGDFIFLHRFVGPNTAGGGVVIALRMLPRIKRVGVADGCCTVGRYMSITITPLQCIGGDREQHREQECQHQQGGLQPYKFTVHSFYSILSLYCGDIYK